MRVWDVATGQELLALKGHTDPVHSVAFSPDGKTLWSRGSGVKVWDLNTGKELAELGQPPPFARTESAARSPSSSLLALPAGDLIHLVRLSLPDADELAFRKAKARFDPFWHEEQVAECEKKAAWFAAVFHRRLLAENDPQNLWKLHNLACTYLAAGDEEGYRRLHARFVNLRDRLTLSVMLGQRMHPLTLAPLLIDHLMPIHHFEVITPAQLVRKEGPKVTVQFRVQGIGSNPAGFAELYSEPTWNRAGCFFIRLPEPTRKKFEKLGVLDVVRHFNDKPIRVSGTVTILRFGAGSYPCIQIDDPDQILITDLK